MKKYAQTRVTALLVRLSAMAKRAAENPDDKAVHDLRVSIRRLSRGLRAFAQFFPGKSWKHIRRELSGLMERAAAVRDRDISMELLEKAGVAPKARVMTRLAADRESAAKALQAALGEWRKRDAERQWKGALEL